MERIRETPDEGHGLRPASDLQTPQRHAGPDRRWRERPAYQRARRQGARRSHGAHHRQRGAKVVIRLRGPHLNRARLQRPKFEQKLFAKASTLGPDAGK